MSSQKGKHPFSDDSSVGSSGSSSVKGSTTRRLAKMRMRQPERIFPHRPPATIGHPLPMDRDEAMSWWHWDGIDILLVTGDAYVDHPAFGVAVIGRVLVQAGYRVGICSQPTRSEDLEAMGRPLLFCGITAGNMDSMLCKYTSQRRLRSDDAYSAGGRIGDRPDHATVVYSSMVKHAFKGLPIVLGGIEASLRRFAHWDHWQEKMRRSILADSKADILVYGMGEEPVLEIAARLAQNGPTADLSGIRGTCRILGKNVPDPAEVILLPTWQACVDSPAVFLETTKTILAEQDPVSGKPMVQDQGWCRILQEPPPTPLFGNALDQVYAHPYTRRVHPRYIADGVPALKTVQNSIQTHRGCNGSCSFCSIHAHQGRMVTSRSKESICDEAVRLTKHPDFHGTIDDLGGPSANMWHMTCARWAKTGACRDRECLWPTICPNLHCAGQPWVELLTTVAGITGVRHAFVQSGLRHDLLLRQGDHALAALLSRHISGRLKVAPESADDSVLKLMHKPPYSVYQEFLKKVQNVERRINRRIGLIPYLIAAHPGAELGATVDAACRLHQDGQEPDQVQEFIPLPMTLATAMHVAASDGTQQIPVVTAGRERRLHKALLHSSNPENRKLVEEALTKAGKQDRKKTLLGQAVKRRHP